MELVGVRIPDVFNYIFLTMNKREKKRMEKWWSELLPHQKEEYIEVVLGKKHWGYVPKEFEIEKIYQWQKPTQ